MFKHAVIIAGGMGSRMRPLTDYVPKPLVKLNDVPLIHYVINFLRTNNIENIFVTYGHRGSMLLEQIGEKVEGFINTTGKDNSYFLFKSIIKHINEPVIVCPCDMVVSLDLEEVYKDYILLGEPASCIVPVFTELDADAITKQGSLVSSISRDHRTGIYASGVQILNPVKINNLIQPVDNFYEVWKNLIDKKQLYLSSITPTEWKVFDRLKDLL